MTTPQEQIRVYVGSYSKPGPYFEANGAGIYTLALDLTTGALTEIGCSEDIVNASYLAKLPGENRVVVTSDEYFSQDQNHGCEVHLCEIDEETGKLRKLASESTHGTATCHLTLNRAGDRAYVASYMNGILTAHDVCEGKISPATDIVRYSGSSANVDRQEGAHAHQAVLTPDECWLYVCDLGSDKIWIHDLSDLNGEPAFVEVPAGYGPRHLVCHPEMPLVYLFCELSSMLLVFRREKGSLVFVSEHDTLPKSVTAVPAGAAIRIHPSLKSLVVSNRSDDSITFFRIDASGLPEFVSHIATGGDEPRDVEFDPSGRWLLIANQNSNTMTVFPVSPDTGLTTSERPVAELACGSPVAILFH